MFFPARFFSSLSVGGGVCYSQSRFKDSAAKAYMKFPVFTPFILVMLSVLALAGCDSLGLRDPFLADQVPPEVKAEPRLVATPSAPVSTQTWPRLGDVPFKPKDFSPQPVYEHYMNELEYNRAESEAARKQVEAASPLPPDAAPQNPATSGPLLMPPQLPQSPEE